MNKLHYTPFARQQRRDIVGDDVALDRAFLFTETGLRARHFGPGRYTEPVAYTSFTIEFEVDRDRMARITVIEVINISGNKE